MEPDNQIAAARRPWRPQCAVALLAWLIAGSAVAQDPVLGPAPAGAGTKTLYLYAPGTPDPNGFNEGPAPYLSRTPPSATQSDVDVDRNDPPRTWTLTPALRSPLTIDAGTLPVTLYLAKNGNGGPPAIRTLRVALATTGAASGPLGSPVTLTFAAPSGANPLAVTFNVPLASVTTLPAGTQLALTLTNLTPNIPTQRIRVFPTQGGDFSRIELPALTVINVDSAATFAGAYPAAVAQSSFVPGAVVSLRATVSDPFGRFDIARVEIDLSDPLGNVVAAAAPMTPVAAVSEAAGIYEYLLTLPATAAPGNWDYRLTAIEGSEGLIRHSFSGSFAVGGARVLVTKSAQTVADPINGGANPKAIPGAVVLYSLSVANNGAIATDADSVVITDALPDNVALYVEAAGGDPVVFLDGSPGSGLSFDYAADVSYSSAPGGGPPFSHAPAPDASGFDAAITGIRINPSGALGADSGAGTPAFELRYRVRID